jgi:hypothetical protein
MQCLGNLGSQTLYISAHGSVGRVNGLDPRELASFLTKRGLDKTYTGKIVLIACEAGREAKPGKLDTSYAARLQKKLRKYHKINVDVEAPPGYVKVTGSMKDPAQPFQIRSERPGENAGYEKGVKEVKQKLGREEKTWSSMKKDLATRKEALEARLAELEKAHKGIEAQLKPTRDQFLLLCNQLDELERIEDKGDVEEHGRKIEELDRQKAALKAHLDGLREKVALKPLLDKKKEVRGEIRNTESELEAGRQAHDKALEEIGKLRADLDEQYLLPVDKGLIKFPKKAKK